MFWVSISLVHLGSVTLWWWYYSVAVSNADSSINMSCLSFGPDIYNWGGFYNNKFCFLTDPIITSAAVLLLWRLLLLLSVLQYTSIYHHKQRYLISNREGVALALTTTNLERYAVASPIALWSITWWLSLWWWIKQWGLCYIFIVVTTFQVHLSLSLLWYYQINYYFDYSLISWTIQLVIIMIMIRLLWCSYDHTDRFLLVAGCGDAPLTIQIDNYWLWYFNKSLDNTSCLISDWSVRFFTTFDDADTATNTSHVHRFCLFLSTGWFKSVSTSDTDINLVLFMFPLFLFWVVNDALHVRATTRW